MIQMIKDRFSYQVKFLRWKTIIGTQRDGIQPELAGPALPTSGDMSWFITIKTIKEKSVRTWNTRNLRDYALDELW